MSEYNDDAWDEYLSTGIDPTGGDLGDEEPSVYHVENISTSNNRPDNHAAPFLRFLKRIRYYVLTRLWRR